MLFFWPGRLWDVRAIVHRGVEKGRIMVEKVQGIGASRGLTMGPVKRFVKEKIAVNQGKITEDAVRREQNAAKDAFEKYREELAAQTPESETEQAVRDAHLELLGDPFYIETVSETVASKLIYADAALEETTDFMASQMEALDDPYLQERGADYRDIGRKVLEKLKGIQSADLSSLAEPMIIVAEELTPSDTATMDKERVLGFINDLGGATSHTSIIAQTLGIPCLVGTKDASRKLKDGDFVVLDADQGVAYINPTEEIRSTYAQRIDAEKEEQKRLDEERFAPALTTNGHRIEVATNIGNLKDLDLGLSSGAEGVGLFRTEFLYMDKDHFPTEEEQFDVYKAAAEKLDGKPLVIRTLDIGGDKSLPYFDFPTEENPFLGWRALRFCFDEEEIFMTQLRALLRASAYGNVKILLPMIVSVDELLHVQDLLDRARTALEREGEKFDPAMEVGVMIETPASVLVAHDLARHCDFFSIGTNDLTQYVLAADRGNERVAKIYNTFNPAVVRSIGKVIEAAHTEGIWCGMCGGFAGDPQATILLLGLGLDEFSAPASKIAKVKDLIRQVSDEEAKEFADSILKMETVREVMEAIDANPRQ